MDEENKCLKLIKERIRDKERALSRAQVDSETSLKQIEDYTRLCTYKDEKECNESLAHSRIGLKTKREELEKSNSKILEAEKIKDIMFNWEHDLWEF